MPPLTRDLIVFCVSTQVSKSHALAAELGPKQTPTIGNILVVHHNFCQYVAMLFDSPALFVVDMLGADRHSCVYPSLHLVRMFVCFTYTQAYHLSRDFFLERYPLSGTVTAASIFWR